MKTVLIYGGGIVSGLAAGYLWLVWYFTHDNRK